MIDKKKRDTLIYLAGPYTGSCSVECTQNIRIAESYAMHLWNLGYPTICPHLNSAHFDGCAPESLFLSGTLLMLEKCDVVVLIEGWRESNGTLGEIYRANELAIPVYDGVEALEADDPIVIKIRPAFDGETSKVDVVNIRPPSEGDVA